IYKRLYDLLRTKSEKDSVDILKRIRMGEEVDSIVRFIEDGDLLLQLSLKPETRYVYPFPHLRNVPAFLKDEDNPYYDSLLLHAAVPLQRPLTGDQRTLSSQGQAPVTVPYDAAEVVDPRFSSIRASDWTQVTDDSNLVVELLKVHFLLEYPSFPLFHKDYFLEDMAANRHRFCSSLL